MEFTKEQLMELISEAGEWAEIYEHPIHDKPQRDFFEGMARAMTAYLAVLTSSPAPVVPDGYVLVPVEPTEKMINAWLSEIANWRGHVAGYKAMLAAAPQQDA